MRPGSARCASARSIAARASAGASRGSASSNSCRSAPRASSTRASREARMAGPPSSRTVSRTMRACARSTRIAAESLEPRICRVSRAPSRTEVGRISTVAREPGATSNSAGAPLRRARNDPAATVALPPRRSSPTNRQEPSDIRCTSTRSPGSRAPEGRPTKRVKRTSATTASWTLAARAPIRKAPDSPVSKDGNGSASPVCASHARRKTSKPRAPDAGPVTSAVNVRPAPGTDPDAAPASGRCAVIAVPPSFPAADAEVPATRHADACVPAPAASTLQTSFC